MQIFLYEESETQGLIERFEVYWTCSTHTAAERQGSRLYAIKIKMVKRNRSTDFGSDMLVDRIEGGTKSTERRPEKTARREVNYLVFVNFSICNRDYSTY